MNWQPISAVLKPYVATIIEQWEITMMPDETSNSTQPIATFWGVFIYVAGDSPYLCAMFRSKDDADEYAYDQFDAEAAVMPLAIAASFDAEADPCGEDHEAHCALDDSLQSHSGPLFGETELAEDDAVNPTQGELDRLAGLV